MTGVKRANRFALSCSAFYPAGAGRARQAFLRPNAWPELLAFCVPDSSGVFGLQHESGLLEPFQFSLAVPGLFFGRYQFLGKRLLRSVMILPLCSRDPGCSGDGRFYGQNGIFNRWLAVFFLDGTWLLPGCTDTKGLF